MEYADRKSKGLSVQENDDDPALMGAIKQITVIGLAMSNLLLSCVCCVLVRWRGEGGRQSRGEP